MIRLAARSAVAAVLAAASLVPFAPPAAAAGSVAVRVDLRPGSTDRTVNMRGHASLPVAILSAAGFDATTVVASSVCFGERDNALQRDCTENHGTGHPDDVDGDGDTDLLLHFGLADSGLDAGDTQACLEGRTLAGDHVYGCDAVEVANGAPEAELPDLSVGLATDLVAVDPHATVRWTAQVANDGPGATTVWPGTALLRFTAPAGLAVSGVAAPAGYACSAGAGGTHSCAPDAPDTVAVGASRTFVLTGVVPDVPGVVNVRADADPSSAIAEVDETDNRADAPVDVLAPNLSVTLAAAPGAASPGERLTWTATLANGGPGAARLPAGADVLRLAVPAGLPGTAVQPPAGWSCAFASARHTCGPDAPRTLPAGGTAVFELTAVAPATPGSYEVVATADPALAFPEADENDNVADAAVLVQLPNLVASVVVTPDLVGAGETVEWVATVTNVGPGRARVPAGGEVLRFATSVDLDGVAVSGGTGFTCAPAAAREYACTADAALALAAGDLEEFRLRGALPSGARGADVTATADPAGLVAESDEGDNAATSGVAARLTDLAVAVTVAPDPVDAAHTVVWTAHVTNAGNDAVTIPSGARAIRFGHPVGMLNLFASTPAGYSCFVAAPQVVECATTTAVSIPAGGSAEFRLGGTAPREPGPVTSTATVDPADVVAESDEGNNAASATVTVRPPDLSLDLSVTPDPVDALATTTWRARIANDGPAAARVPTGTRLVRMDVPAGMLNLAVSTPAGYTCFIEAPEVVDCATTSVRTLAAGEVVEVTLFGTAPRQPGPITTTMTADPLGAIPEGDETDNSDSATTTVQPPDLSMTLTVSPDPVDALATTTWRARIANDGPANARVTTGTRLVRFVVPAGLTNLAVSTPAGYTCFIEAPQTVDCETTTTVNVAAGTAVEVTLFGTAPRQPGPIGVTATADPLGAIPEGDEEDNAATTSVVVQPPDLSMTLTVSPDPVDALATTTWRARIANDGPANARVTTGTRLVRFVVPAGLTNLAVSTPAGYTCFIEAPQTVDCETTTTVNVAAGTAVEVTLFGTAPRQPGPIGVTATADPLGAIPEGDEGDNEATATVTVRVPDLSVAMSAPATVTAGAPVTYTTTLANGGPAAARLSGSTVVLRFAVPAGLADPAVTPPAGYTCAAVDAATIECRPSTTTTLAAGGSATFELTGTAPAAPATLAATATADPRAAVPETDETDNEATSTVTVAEA